LQKAWNEHHVGLQVTVMGDRYPQDGDAAKCVSNAVNVVLEAKRKVFDEALAHIINALVLSQNAVR